MGNNLKSAIERVIEYDFINRVTSGEWVGQDPKYTEFGHIRDGIIYYNVLMGMGYQMRNVDLKSFNIQNLKDFGFRRFKIDNFGLRHFDPNFGGTKILDITPKDFESKLMLDPDIQSYNLIDSKMDFCKYLIIPNFTKCKSGSEEITISNYQYLRSGYSARREGELPVLTRWFEFPVEMPPAKYLQLVLYSKDQLIKEAQARNEEIGPDLEDWNIIAILGQNSGKIEPMIPVTMMRNALGMEEGGNGHPLDKEEYQKSVDFWSKRAVVK